MDTARYTDTAHNSEERNDLIPRETIESIVAHRNEALRLYAIAFEKIYDAGQAVKLANETAQMAHPGVTPYNSHNNNEVKAFREAVRFPERDEYLKTAERLIDVDVWAWIIDRTKLETLMDKEAKDELRTQLQFSSDSLPPVTVENIYSTIERFVADSSMIFMRGLANAFSSLDRRFRSHDGFKIGSRVILTRVFDDDGFWNYHNNTRDTLMDIERVFFVLDGREIGASYASAIGAIDFSRGMEYGARQSETETEFFRIRCFKNGNVHLWFNRDDLVDKVNRLLADYYGEVIADDRAEEEEDPFFNVKTAPAKRFGFFPTPEEAAEIVISEAKVWRWKSEPPYRILEPSAGTGNLSRRCVESVEAGSGPNHVDCIEIQPDLADQLRQQGIYRSVHAGDFLAVQPVPVYDRVVMNPPFDRERDIDHVVHALKFLRPGGRLVSIMSAGTEFRETRKSIAFRELIDGLGGTWRDLRPGSFASVGTYVNTIVLSVVKK